MIKNILRSFSYLILISSLFSVSAYAKQSVFSNRVQYQSLNNLNDIIDDATRMNLKRSSQSIHLTINRLNIAINQIRALGNRRIKPSRQNSFRPYAFIQSVNDRRKLIKNMSELIQLHQQFKRALQSKNITQQKQLKSSMFKRTAKIKHIRFRWRSKIGKIGVLPERNNQVKGLRICRNLLPHEKFYSQWESCCDIGNKRSRWLNRASNKVSNWKGSCRSWGMR